MQLRQKAHSSNSADECILSDNSLQRQFYFPHDPVCLQQDFDDVLVVANIVIGQRTPLAILEPFLRPLVPADKEFPRGFQHICK